MVVVHELKIAPEYFGPVAYGTKSFEIRKNDRDFQVDDILLLKEFDGKYTGRETAMQVSYITDYEQKDGYVVLAIKVIPKSFVEFLSMTDKEEDVFKEIITHMHLYGLSNRDMANTCWDIIRILLGNDDLSDTDQQWYMEYWDED